jgi:peptidoglycan/xylan/chitin deacetylase (PgdA/CDA1 family)
MKKLLAGLALLAASYASAAPSEKPKSNPNGEFPILMFHNVVENPKSQASTSPEKLTEMLQFLYDEGFVSVPLRDALDGKIDVDQGKKPVAITVDDRLYNRSFLDAYRNFVEKYPIFGFNVTFFVNGASCDANLEHVTKKKDKAHQIKKSLSQLISDFTCSYRGLVDWKKSDEKQHTFKIFSEAMIGMFRFEKSEQTIYFAPNISFQSHGMFHKDEAKLTLPELREEIEMVYRIFVELELPLPTIHALPYCSIPKTPECKQYLADEFSYVMVCGNGPGHGMCIRFSNPLKFDRMRVDRLNGAEVKEVKERIIESRSRTYVK